jgi:hypothetical protein
MSTPTRWRRVAAIVIVDVLAISALVVVAEVALRHRGFEPLERSYPVGPGTHPPPRTTWLRTDGALGWVAGLPPPEYNAQGFRDAKDFDRVDRASGEVRVMVLGDSFMMGAGVEAAQSVPALLERRLGGSVRVYNLAMAGWGIDQMYLAFQRYHERINPRVVILAYIDDDVRRVLDAFRTYEGVAKPVLTSDGKRLVLRTHGITRAEASANAFMSRSVLVSQAMERFYLARDARPVVAAILRQMARSARERGERLVVVHIPSIGSEKPLGRLTRWLYRFDRVLPPEESLWLEPRDEMAHEPDWLQRFYFAEGAAKGHLSVEGNRWLADYLYDRWHDEGLPGE